MLSFMETGITFFSNPTDTFCKFDLISVLTFNFDLTSKKLILLLTFMIMNNRIKFHENQNVLLQNL